MLDFLKKNESQTSQITPPASAKSEAQKAGREEIDDEILGIEIHEFARNRELSVQEVWRKIKNGVLMARSENGRVYIYPRAEEQKALIEISPLDEDFDQKLMQLNLPPLAVDHQPSQDVMTEPSSMLVAEFNNYLKKVQEEKQEIINLAKQSISQIAKMSEQIISAKDAQLKDKSALLEEYEKKINQLQQQLADQQQESLNLREEIDDLQTLAATLMNHSELSSHEPAGVHHEP